MPGDKPDAAPIAAVLSPERLAPYLRATGGDLTAAVRLYEWNLAVSGALHEALGILEVALRNALSAQLAAHHGTLAGNWYDDPLGVLSDLAHDDIAAARRRVRKLRRPETPGRIIAELGFGFWKFLLAKRYEATLWTGYLRHAFPNLQPQKRATVYRALDELHTVRNRIAHHEPIHNRDLPADTLTIYRLLDWIDHEPLVSSPTPCRGESRAASPAPSSDESRHRFLRVATWPYVPDRPRRQVLGAGDRSGAASPTLSGCQNAG